MQGFRKGVIKRIQQLSPKCVGIHCIIHREALCSSAKPMRATTQ